MLWVKFSCQNELSRFNGMRLTVISFHLFSGEVNVHHDFENSNNVGGGLCTPSRGVRTSSRGGTCDDGDDRFADRSSGSTEFSGAGISLVEKIVFWPVARKIPPPTRLGLTLSLACFASLKFSGFEFDSLVVEARLVVSLGSAGPEDDDPPAVVGAGLRNRVDTGSKVSGWEMGLVGILTGLDSTRGVVGATGNRSSGNLTEALPEGSTILMGTRRRLVAAVRS
jgi:hypothetical protein